MSQGSFSKRQKEKNRQDKQKEKLEKRKHKDTRRVASVGPDGVDPDIAGIVPGPQPPTDDF